MRLHIGVWCLAVANVAVRFCCHTACKPGRGLILDRCRIMAMTSAEISQYVALLASVSGGLV